MNVGSGRSGRQVVRIKSRRPIARGPQTRPGPPKTDDDRQAAVTAAYDNLLNKGAATSFKNNIPPEAVLVAAAHFAGHLAKEGGIEKQQALDFVRLHMSSVM